jgi:hypothetical protein
MRYRVFFDAGLMRVENLASTGIRDHLRYCTPLYAGIASLGTHLISDVLKPWPCCSLQWSIAAHFLLMAGYAAALNASTLYPMRGRQIARMRRSI